MAKQTFPGEILVGIVIVSLAFLCWIGSPARVRVRRAIEALEEGVNRVRTKYAHFLGVCVLSLEFPRAFHQSSVNSFCVSSWQKLTS